MEKNESGSIHAIVIGVLTVALVGALGFIFWQNILSKNNDSSKGDSTLATASSDTKKSLNPKQYCTPVEKFCFDYPGNWTVSLTQSNPKQDGVGEAVTVSDESGKKWLQLTTGMGGVGGACGSTKGSFTKILKTYTTKINGTYLIRPGAEEYITPTVHAVSAVSYDEYTKAWMPILQLNTSKASAKVGKMDICDLGIAVFPGKNTDVKWDDGSHSSGSIAFGLYADDTHTTLEYKSEAEATAFLDTKSAQKAYVLLRSAHYSN